MATNSNSTDVKVTFGDTQKGKRKLIDSHGYTYTFEKFSRSKKNQYWRCTNRNCTGRFIYSVLRGTGSISRFHVEGELDAVGRAKDAALERLRELTLAANTGVKPIEIVRKILREMPQESRHAMPSEDALVVRVRRLAKSQGIKLKPSSFHDWDVDESQDGDANTQPMGAVYISQNYASKPAGPSTSAAVAPTDNADNNTITESGEINFEPVAITDVIDPETGEAKPQSGLVFLKQKLDGHYRAMVSGQIFSWRKDLRKLVQLYRCRELNRGCLAKLILYLQEKRYEVKGAHVHQFNNKPGSGSGSKRRCVANLKLVDDDGNELRAGTMDDILADVPFDTDTLMDSGSKAAPDSVSVVTPSTVQHTVQEVSGENNFMDDGGNDFQMNDIDNADDDVFPQTAGAEAKSRTKGENKINFSVSTNFKTLTSSPTSKPNMASATAKKTGERCFVCGDELVFSETLASSEETFRKACCYLNVRSECDWFPKSPAGHFYSFCESCTKEIYRIHDLYKKIEEIQSIIFKKVEHVEKRVVDAEIVDTWMAEASSTTAMRFEGFRKQIMINYRNKLKLRREVRVGRKIGKHLLEATPVITAQMFASDPSRTDAFRKTISDHDNKKEPNTTPMFHSTSPRRTRGRPKSKKRPERQEQNEMGVDESFETTHDDPGFQDYDDDARSVASEKEVKFWHDDPKKLRLSEATSGNEDYGDDALDEFTGGGNSGDDLTAGDSAEGSDPDYDENDDDWEKGGKRRSKRSTRSQSKSQQASSISGNLSRLNEAEKKITEDSVTPSSSKKGSVGRKRIHSVMDFPDTVVRRDGRIFMQGIEIVKNPPGHYARRPYSASFSCGECGKIVLSFWGIRRHICGHHLGLYKCHICFKQYSEPRVVARHIETVHGIDGSGEKITMIPCLVCEKPFKEIRNMHAHMWTHLSDEEKQDPANAKYKPRTDPTKNRARVGIQTFMCSYCSKTFFVPKALKKHEMLHTGEAPKEQCHYCGRLYVVGRALSTHVNKCGRKSRGVDANQTFPCPKCPVRFKSRATRSKHIRRFHRHLTSLPFSCPKCPRSFSTKSAFKNHRRRCLEGLSAPGGPSKARTSTDMTLHDVKIDPDPTAANEGSQSQSSSYSSQSGSTEQNAAVVGGYSYNMFSYPHASLFSNQQSQHHGMQ